MDIGCHLPTTQGPATARDDLGRMLERLGMVVTTVRPAVKAA